MKSPNDDPLVMGLVGNAASGKDRIAELFTRNGFVHYSTSDVVREIIHARGLTTSRQLQTQVANETRAERGGGYFIDQSLDRIREVHGEAGKIILSGLYAVVEGTYLTRQLGGVLIGVVASEPHQNDLETRYQRLFGRADGPRDSLNPEEFLAAFARENSGVLATETNVGELMDMARFTIINSGGLTDDDLNSRVRSIVGEVTQNA